jgi:uncharacterized Ntn-hydrolase superfamily protein
VTWSIVAVDPETREVGVGAASCTVAVEIVRGIVPGLGVVTAQASTNLWARNEAIAAIARGASAGDVLGAAEEVSGRNGLSAWRDQQMAVALLTPKPMALAHTGADAMPWAGAHTQGPVSVQGNILRGPEVVDAAFEAFHDDTDAPDLALRILRALEAGGAAGGDSRCPRDCPATTAFLAVAGPAEINAEEPALFLVAPRAFGIEGAIEHAQNPRQPDPGDPSPTVALRRMLEEARA